jgi:hypothetical protein
VSGIDGVAIDLIRPGTPQRERPAGIRMLKGAKFGHDASLDNVVEAMR